MKKILYIISLLAAGTTGAEELASTTVTYDSKLVICNSTEKIVAALKDDFSEFPLWIGLGEGRTAGSTFLLALNSTTRTWTLLEKHSELTCILGMGASFEQLQNEIK